MSALRQSRGEDYPEASAQHLADATVLLPLSRQNAGTPRPEIDRSLRSICLWSRRTDGCHETDSFDPH